MFVGLDLASRISGWTCGDGATPPACDVWKHPRVTEPDGSADYGKLLASLKAYLDILFARFPGIQAVAYEAPILVTRGRGREYGDNLSTLRLIYPMSAFVEWYCLEIAGVPCHEVTVAEIKSEVTGNRHADKEDLALIAEKCGLVLPPRPGRTDASDSWGAWLIVLRHYDKAMSAKWDRLIWTPRGALL